MKVLMINTLFPPLQVGGAELSVAELVRDLQSRGVDAVSVSVTPGKAAAPDGTDSDLRIPIQRPYWPFGTQRNGVFRKGLWHLQEAFVPDPKGVFVDVIKSVKPDLVHTHNLAGIGSHVWPAAAGLGIPVIHTVRDYYLMCIQHRFHNGAACKRRHLHCRFLAARHAPHSKHVNHVVGISRYVLDVFRSAGFFEKASASVISNQPAVGHVSPLSAEQMPRFGYIGMLTPAKGFDALVEAMREASVRLSRKPLVVAGNTPRHRFEYWAARRLDEFEFRGRMRVEDFLSEVDIVIVPSLWEEPFGRVAAEAKQTGRIVIASNRGGLPEALGDYPRGILFDPAVPDGLIAAMRRAVRMYRNLPPLPEPGPVQSTTQAYIEIYEKLIQRE